MQTEPSSVALVVVDPEKWVAGAMICCQTRMKEFLGGHEHSQVCVLSRTIPLVSGAQGFQAADIYG